MHTRTPLLALALLAGCGAPMDATTDDTTSEQEDFDAALDDKSDAPRSRIARFGALRTSGGWSATGYNTQGSAITRMDIARSGAGWRATLIGNGTSLTLDFAGAVGKRGDVVITGVAGGQPFRIAGNRTSSASVTKSGGPVLTTKQVALLGFWSTNAPQVMAKASMGDCAIAVAEALVDVAACLGGSVWSCFGAVGSVASAISTCTEALN